MSTKLSYREQRVLDKLCSGDILIVDKDGYHFSGEPFQRDPKPIEALLRHSLIFQRSLPQWGDLLETTPKGMKTNAFIRHGMEYEL